MFTIFKIQFKVSPADFTAVNPHSSLTPVAIRIFDLLLQSLQSYIIVSKLSI